MGGKRQKNQSDLAFGPDSRGETPTADPRGPQAPMAERRDESLASTEGRSTSRTAVVRTRTPGGVGGGEP